MSRVADDVPTMDRVIVEGLDQALAAILQFLIVLGYLLYHSWELTLVTLLPLPFIGALTAWWSKKAESKWRASSEASSALNAILHDNLAGIRQIKAYNVEPQALSDFDETHLTEGKRPDALTGKIEFLDVSFSYDMETPALENIRLTANPGQTVALVGATGSGKSTMPNLLSRFYEPTSGEILLDGVPISEISKEWLRDNTGFVTQDPFLFNTTEHLVQQALERLRANRTSFVIAHRLSTIRDADLICVLDHGNLVESGTHQELLESNTHYARLRNGASRSSGD